MLYLRQNMNRVYIGFYSPYGRKQLNEIGICWNQYQKKNYLCEGEIL